MAHDDLITESVHGYDVSHDAKAERGADYLEFLSRDEAEVFFEYAKRHGEAEFRDKGGRSYTLTHQDKNNYSLEKS